MTKKKLHIIPLNRVEGDLEIQIELDGEIVSDARSSGTMFRGLENLLKGRGLLDGLVITPRICGICTTSHLNAAAKALDMAFDTDVPSNGKRIRNITLMAEQLQNDIRHTFLLFMADFTNKAYVDNPLYQEAVTRYEPLKGLTVMETVRETKKLLEIIAIIGGQWPHSSFMVPGGVVSVPSANDIATCRYILQNFRKWYERRVLGCSLERWTDVTSRSELFAWVDENRSQRESEMGYFIRLADMVGLSETGKGHDNFISFGSLDLPNDTMVKGNVDRNSLIPAGFSKNTESGPFSQENITEDISHSRFEDDNPARHPFKGTTIPLEKWSEGEKYSWAKAPRYKGFPAETGPLAEMIISSKPLFLDIVGSDGPSVFVRQLARLARPAILLPVVDQWLEEIATDCSDFFSEYIERDTGKGFGLVQAARGALGHWVTFDGGKIENYQVITPTAWNASPRDVNGVRGPWEEALIGTQIKDLRNPIEVEHIIRSFDPCLVCTVHAVQT